MSLGRTARWILCAALVAGVGAVGAGAAPLRQGREVANDIRSVALGGLVHARVVLPAGYDDLPHRRYPVVYFLHGLPATATSYRGNNWLLAASRRQARRFSCSRRARATSTAIRSISTGVRDGTGRRSSRPS